MSLTRRQLLRHSAQAGAALGLAGLGLEPWIEEAMGAKVRPGNLKDIEHVVIFMQENRSFDHYFGRFPGVRGFSDHNGAAAFTQSGYPSGSGTLQPWHLNAEAMGGDCTHDITHDWGPQHRSWNGGAMDKWVAEHSATDGPDQGSLTMAYYDQSDLEFYWALARAFTICDRYHCSVIGPTDPNRLMSMTGTLDPAGAYGGPHLETLVSKRAEKAGKFTWPTYPEALQAKGVSWKVYTDPAGGSFDNVLPYFANFQSSAALQARGTLPKYPDDFLSDVAANKLPQVSWLLSSIQDTEHPEFSGPLSGMSAARQVVSALTKNPKLWKKTALFLTWDENGGFFDHVAPPVAPAGTPGEYVTAPTLPDAAEGIRGPIGLGFRVPMIIVSPFSRGGFVSSNVFDHTSTLRFCEKRFGAKVPNLSAWRRAHTGDLTAAFNFVKPNFKAAKLPAVPLASTPGPHTNCFDKTPVTPTTTVGLPKQLPGKPKRPHGLKGQRKH